MFHPVPKPFLVAALVILVAFPITRIGYAMSLEEEASWLDDSGIDGFGFSVSLANDLAVVGNPFDYSAGGYQPGAVWIYRRTNDEWVNPSKLTGTEWSSDQFGWSVDAEAELIVVGAPGSGYVNVYPIDSNSLGDPITLVSEIEGSRFGAAVSTDGNTIVVGAPGEDAVYIYTRADVGWGSPEKIEGWDNSQFGAAVSVSGNYLAVGAPIYESMTGAACFFEREGEDWSETVRRFGGTSYDRFGSAVSVEGNRIVVGAPGTEGITEKGAAYVYNRSDTGWDAPVKLTSPGYSDQFGWTLAQGDGILVIGALNKWLCAYLIDSSYFFPDEAVLSEPIIVFFSTEYAAGYSVDVDNGRVLAGAPGEHVSPYEDEGSAYLYALKLDEYVFGAEGLLTSIEGAPTELVDCGLDDLPSSFEFCYSISPDRPDRWQPNDMMGAYRPENVMVRVGNCRFFSAGDDFVVMDNEIEMGDQIWVNASEAIDSEHDWYAAIYAQADNPSNLVTSDDVVATAPDLGLTDTSEVMFLVEPETLARGPMDSWERDALFCNPTALHVSSLIVGLNTLGLPDGLSASLQSKLVEVVELLEQQDMLRIEPEAVPTTSSKIIRLMELFIKRIELLEGKMIDEDDAQELIEQASSILDEF